MVGLFALMALAMVACQWASNAFAPPIKANALLRVFVQPEARRTPVIKVIQEAQRSILVEMHLMNDRDIIDALGHARGRGVDVRVILESQPAGNGTGNRPAMAELQAVGVQVRTGNPAWKSTHLKAMVVDDRIGLIMTFDQTRASFGTNRDYAIIDTDPDDVAEMVSAFEADWNRVKPTLSDRTLVWSPGDARERVAAFIGEAKRTIDIQAADIRDQDILGHLIAAARRGVAVRMVTSPARGGQAANTRALQALSEAGVQIRILKVPYVHATLVVVDNTRAFVGSHDLSPASLDLNRELGIMIAEKQAVQDLAGTFLGDWYIGKQR